MITSNEEFISTFISVKLLIREEVYMFPEVFRSDRAPNYLSIEGIVETKIVKKMFIQKSILANQSTRTVTLY